MPLQLGDVSTERPQVILFDPDNAREKADADKRRRHLIAQGFVATRETETEYHFDPPPRGPNLGTFRILSQNGDDRIVWDRTIPAQVREAFKKFKELIEEGYKAFAVRSNGERGHAITEFDPGLQEILFIPKTIPG